MSENRVQEVTELLSKRLVIEVDRKGFFVGVLTDISPSGTYIVLDGWQAFRREDVMSHEVLADQTLPYAERLPFVVKDSLAAEVLRPAPDTAPFPKR